MLNDAAKTRSAGDLTRVWTAKATGTTPAVHRDDKKRDHLPPSAFSGTRTSAAMTRVRGCPLLSRSAGLRAAPSPFHTLVRFGVT